MSEEGTPQTTVLPLSAETLQARPEVLESKVEHAADAIGTKAEASEPAKKVATGVALEHVAHSPEPTPVVETKHHVNTNDQPISDDGTHDRPAAIQEAVEKGEDIKPNDTAPTANESADPAFGTPASAGKSKARRKSGGIPEHKNKKLNKKSSKAKLTHTDAKPGDYFFVRLKGYPLWPGIVCDESMLPNTLLKSRPVTAARPDGTYRAEYEDGGPKVKDRTFPVMYLHTNEFSWIPNHDLVDLDFETVGNVSSTLRKDLYAAHLLAAEKHDLDYFKEILQNFMAARAAELQAKEAAKAAKKATKAKRKSKAVVDGEEDGDVEMPDAAPEADSEEAEAASSEKANKKKRKAADPAEGDTPQTDSVKKPKTTISLKLTNTPKATNGASTPKPAKDQSATKSAKPKSKKAAPKVKATPEVVAPKEPELTPEEKRVKKEKEIMFLRHKLQKGLLTRDQEPKEEEMKQMSEFVSKLEGYADLEVSMIRATKINKVLKAILKLNNIPKEEEFQFKPRSQTLLDKWNKLLASEQGTPVAPATTTNGIGDEGQNEAEEAKVVPLGTINGTKELPREEIVEEKVPAFEEPVTESEENPTVDNVPAPLTEGSTKELISKATSIESNA